MKNNNPYQLFNVPQGGKRKYNPPKPSAEDWETVNKYWGILLGVEKWLFDNHKTASYTEIENAIIKKEKYRKLISAWNSKFLTKTNRYGREPRIFKDSD